MKHHGGGCLGHPHVPPLRVSKKIPPRPSNPLPRPQLPYSRPQPPCSRAPAPQGLVPPRKPLRPADGWKFSLSVLYDIVPFRSAAHPKIKYDKRTGRDK